MEKFFILDGYVRLGELFVRQYDDPHDYSDSYYVGEPLPRRDDSVTATLFYDEGQKTDYITGIFSFPVVSSRLKGIICEFDAEHTEFEPVSVVSTATNEVDETYWYLNLLGLVPCLDWEQSRLRTLDERPDVILGVEHLALDVEQAGGRHIFRIKDLESLILVSERLRRRIEQTHLTGIRFHDIEDFRM